MTDTKEKKGWQQLVSDFAYFLFGEMSQWVKNAFIFLLLAAVWSYFVLKERPDRFVPLTPSQIQIEAAKQRAIDSVNQIAQHVKDSIQANKSVEFMRQLGSYTQNLKYSMKNCIGVNYYGIHNGGGVIKPDGHWELEVYLSTEQEIEIDFPDEEHKKNVDNSIWRGWIEMAAEANKTTMPVYYSDVSKYPEVYTGRAKAYLDQLNIKSCLVMLVRNKGKNFYYVSFNFDIVDPLSANPDMFRKIRKLQNFARVNID